jgi:hypothetical protein
VHIKLVARRAVQADYEDLRNKMEPLSELVQKLQAEKADLMQQLDQVGFLQGMPVKHTQCSSIKQAVAALDLL